MSVMLNALPAFRHANGSLSQQGLRLLGRMSEIWWWCHGHCFWFLSGLQPHLRDTNDSAWEHYICWSWGVKKKKWWTWKSFSYSWHPYSILHLNSYGLNLISSSSRSVCDLISPKIPWKFIRFFPRLNLRSDSFGGFATKRSQDACGGLGAVLIGMASTISQNVMLPLVA